MAALYAVLTGDLVGSSDLTANELDTLRQSLTGAVAKIRGWRDGLVVGDVEFYRGDAWQLLITDPKLFFRVALYLRTTLRQHRFWDTRMAVGLGQIEKIDDRQISLSIGEGFTLSGHKLDQMGSAPGFRFDAPDWLKPKTGWVGPMLDLCDQVIGRLKPRQAATVCAALAPSAPTQREIARDLGISQQGVSSALASAGWFAIEHTLRFAEAFDWQGREGPS